MAKLKSKGRGSKAKKSTQTYVSRDLFNGEVDKRSAYSLDYNNAGQKTGVRVSILRGQYSFTYIINRLCEGESRNGIPWKKWEMFATAVVSTKAIGKNGQKRLNVYAKFRVPGNKTVWFNFHNCTPQPHTLSKVVRAEDWEEFNKEVEDLYRENIGEPPYSAKDYTRLNRSRMNPQPGYVQNEYAFHLAYPLTRREDVESFELTSIISRHFRCDNAIELTRALFGKFYRKDLVRAVSHAISKGSADRIAMGVILKGIIPTDWIITFLNEPYKGAPGWESLEQLYRIEPQNVKSMKDLFKAFTPAQQKRLLMEMVTGRNPDTWTITDSMTSFNALTGAGAIVHGEIVGKTWRDVHNYLAREYRDLRSPEREIVKVPLAKEIEKIQFTEDFRLILPKTNRELRKWGDDMNHCIGSYDSKAVQGDAVFVGIIANGQMIGNAQIDTKKLKVVQIFGKHNRRLDQPVLEKFTDVLTSAKILKKENIVEASGYKDWF